MEYYFQNKLNQLPTTIVILSQTNVILKSLVNGILYGSKEIPSWHPLYGKKYRRCGSYVRRLKLYDSNVIKVVVYRFYCKETKKTYSLLPFFIQRYERHINSVIETVLEQRFVENTPVNQLSCDPTPSEWTIKRWLKKFRDNIDTWNCNLEKYLINTRPTYHAARDATGSLKEKLLSFLKKTEYIVEKSKYKDFMWYGNLSFCNYALAIYSSQIQNNN